MGTRIRAISPTADSADETLVLPNLPAVAFRVSRTLTLREPDVHWDTPGS